MRLFIKNKRHGRKIINHHIVEGTRESHPRVHDLQHPRLGKPRRGLQIMDTRMGFPCPFHIVVIVILIFTSGFIGNIVTVAVIACWVKLRTPTYTMIACLAVSDAYSLLLVTLYWYTKVRGRIYCTYINDEAYLDFYYSTWTLLYLLGRFHPGMQLCSLACLRFTAIVYPLKFKTYCTCKMVILMSVVTSIVILIFSVVITILMFMYVYKKLFAVQCIFFAVLTAINFIVPTVTFGLLHCLKLRALRRSPTLKNNSTLKMNIVLSMIMIIYVLSSASSMIVDIMFCCSYPYRLYRILNSFAYTSFLFNCAINPFIYLFSSPPIAQLFRKMWHRICHKYYVGENRNTQSIEMNTNSTGWN